jgi:hypothetical protein
MSVPAGGVKVPPPGSVPVGGVPSAPPLLAGAFASTSSAARNSSNREMPAAPSACAVTAFAATSWAALRFVLFRRRPCRSPGRLVHWIAFSSV